MDVVIAAQAVGMLKTAIDAIKELTKKLPEGEEKVETEATLAQAETQLKIAEAQLASSLGYNLCRRHFPPEIMLEVNDYLWKCRECGKEIKLQKFEGFYP